MTRSLRTGQRAGGRARHAGSAVRDSHHRSQIIVALIAAIGAVSAAVATPIVVAVTDDDPGAVRSVAPSAPATTSATTGSLDVVWTQPRDGARVENCLRLSGTVVGGVPRGHTIIIGDRGVASDHWSLRYGGATLSADRTRWEASWTLGSLSNASPGDYYLIAIVMSDQQAAHLAKTRAAEGKASWDSPELPEPLLGAAQITVTREFTQSKKCVTFE